MMGSWHDEIRKAAAKINAPDLWKDTDDKQGCDRDARETTGHDRQNDPEERIRVGKVKKATGAGAGHHIPKGQQCG